MKTNIEQKRESHRRLPFLRLSKNLAAVYDHRAARELEGKIPPAGEMSAKLTKGAWTKARLEYNKPPSEKT